MGNLRKLSDITRCPMHATSSNRFTVEMPDGSTTIMTPEQMQVAATVRVAEALEHQLRLLEASALGELRGVLLAMSHLSAADVTPEFRAKMRQLYEEKGGRHG